MSMTEAQKRDAYHEAQHILRIDKKWQQLMPGERKPNFKRGARDIIRRALGQKVQRNQAPLDMHAGLMHEHKPREAALIERTLKNGMYDPSVLLVPARHQGHPAASGTSGNNHRRPRAARLRGLCTLTRDHHRLPQPLRAGYRHLPQQRARPARARRSAHEAARRDAIAQRVRSCALSNKCAFPHSSTWVHSSALSASGS